MGPDVNISSNVGVGPASAAQAAGAVNPLVAVGGGIVDTLLGGMIGHFQNERAWRRTKMMANTQHQREVADLKAAGLNPMLSLRHGGSAAPPASAPDSLNSRIGESIHSALQLNQMKGNIDLQRAQARNLDANSASQEFDTKQKESAAMAGYNEPYERIRELASRVDLNKKELSRLDSTIDLLEKQAQLTSSQTSHSAYGLDKARQESEFWKSWAGNLPPYLKEIIEPASRSMDAATRPAQILRLLKEFRNKAGR